MLFFAPKGHHDLLHFSALSLIGVALATPLHDALSNFEAHNAYVRMVQCVWYYEQKNDTMTYLRYCDMLLDIMP
jgi:hypothetical protein